MSTRENLLTSEQSDKLSEALKKGITIERGNGISQQLAVAMGIDLKKEKLDNNTRKLLRDLSRVISTDEHALTPNRISTKKYGYRAVHSVREGDIIRLDDAKIDTLMEKYAKHITPSQDI